MAGELAARRGDRFEGYTEAVRHLARDPRFDPELERRLQVVLRIEADDRLAD